MGCCNSVLMNFFLGVLMFCFALVFWMTFVLGILVPFNVGPGRKRGKKQILSGTGSKFQVLKLFVLWVPS